MVKAIEVIVDAVTRGDPMSPLKWTSKSLAKIGEELQQQGFEASAPTISKILHKELKYNRQGLMKTKEGKRRRRNGNEEVTFMDFHWDSTSMEISTH